MKNLQKLTTGGAAAIVFVDENNNKWGRQQQNKPKLSMSNTKRAGNQSPKLFTNNKAYSTIPQALF